MKKFLIKTATTILISGILATGFAVPAMAAEKPKGKDGKDTQTVTKESTSEDAVIDNHKAYVQSWIEAVRDKPDSLIKAIKDAQSAANYMDLKAGLITEKEYEKVKDSVMEVKVGKSREMER